MLLLSVALIGACSGDDDSEPTSSEEEQPPTTPAIEGTIDVGDVDAPDRCDPIDPRHCLLPFPSDFHTVGDDSTDTGRRINFARESMPTNKDGVQVDPAEWNRQDGFSPGQPISTYIPELDVEQSRITPSTDIGASLAEDAPVVLWDATDGERLAYWGELDASATSDDARVLYIRPARNYLDGHRIVVGFRDLRDALGATLEPSAAFQAYRDRLDSGVPAIEAQRDRYEQVFTDLGDAGVERDDLYLAWDFTVASTRNLTERILAMRDDAFASLDGGTPTFSVTSVEQNPEDNVARRVTGTVDVPLYLEENGEPGTAFVYGDDDLPMRNGTATFPAGFICNIPPSALDTPARPSLYGHGLLGSNDEVNAGNVREMGATNNIMLCATKWIGFSEDDIGNAVNTLNDLSNFYTVADRSQQGMLNALFLGRAMVDPNGFSTDEAFAGVIDTSELFYDSNSQGAIMGGALTAVSTDFTRAVLGVSGMNYSTLLQRSIDWDTYRAIYDPAYPDEIERGIGISLLQMLWDRFETNGYANHLTDDPLPDTPEHKILMHVAFADHQVANISAEVEARTIGATLACPALSNGRIDDVNPHWGLDCIESYPYDGSAIVYWDSGTPPPPPNNVAPSEGEDPHEDPRRNPDAQRQKSEFLESDGAVLDVCNRTPCTAEPSG